MKLYLENGFADMRSIYNIPAVFIICIGGRGTGKTYGALLDALDENRKFILMRRTQNQLDLINKPDFSPFKAINNDTEYNVVSASLSKYNAGFYHGVRDDDGDIIVSGAPFGFTVALSTISNIRGFDASDVECIIYDEFIPETHDRPIKQEGAAFLNAYETINRNRELLGRAPVKCLLLSNSNTIDSPILTALGATAIIDKMARKRQTLYISPDHTIAVVRLLDSPVSNAKRDTVLYRLAANEDFRLMALDNEFSRGTYEHIAPNANIKEYRPIVSINGVTVYKHKSERKYYCAQFRSGTCPEYDMLPTEKAQFLLKYRSLCRAYYSGSMTFSDIVSKQKFLELFT